MISGALVAVLAAGYVGTAAAVTGKVPDGTTVGGVKVGGMSRGGAQDAIAARAAAISKKQITIAAEGKSLTLDPATSGLSINTSGALDGLTGFSLAPGTVWKHLFGSSQARPLTAKTDVNKLASAIATAGDTFKGAPVNGSVAFNNGKVSVVRSTDGTGIDANKVAREIAADWPAKTDYTATIGHVAPQLTNSEIDTFVKDFADPAMSGPVTIKVGDKSSQLTPSMVSGVLSAKVVDGALKPVIDQSKLNDILDSLSGVLSTPPENAHYGTGGQIVEAKDGTEVVSTGSADLLLKALTAADRTMTLQSKPVKAAMTAADLKNLGTDLVSEFATPLPGGSGNFARTKNIQLAMSRINGTVIAPGEQFSLLAALMPITKANGYIDAPVLVNGVDELGTGGGISQVSTTLYNATFFAGLQEDEHTAHAYWIPRYPMGREATLWVPTIDNKFTNDSGHPIRIEAGAGDAGTTAWVKIYGTKVFTVTSNTGPKFNIVKAGKRVITKAGCIPQPAEDGFSVTVTRVVRKGGVVVKNESLTTRYIPSDLVICK